MRYVKQCIVRLPNVYLALNSWGMLIDVLVALPLLKPLYEFSHLMNLQLVTSPYE